MAAAARRLGQGGLSIVVAYARGSRAIGLRQGLPWPRLPADLAAFARVTRGASVVMGRRTFESDEVAGVPLDGRRNVVLSRGGWAPAAAGVMHAVSWDEALLLADSAWGGGGYDTGERVVRVRGRRMGVFVVGGEQVYRLALDEGSPVPCTCVLATEVEGNWEGDAFFPRLGPEWVKAPLLESGTCSRGWARDETMVEKGVAYRFVTYERQPLSEPSV